MWPLVRRRYALPVLLLFAHGCGSCYSADRPEPPSTSDVTALKIAPSTVFVVPGAIFVMRARILDGLGGVLPSHPDLAWSPGSGLSVVSKGADSAVVKANMLTSGTSLKSTITAQLGTHNAAASVTVLAQTAAGTNDIALGDNRNAMQPDVVLLDDLTAPIPIDDSLIAFVGIGLLGNLSGGTGEVARFASDQAFYREPVSWQVTKDVIDMRTHRVSAFLPALRNSRYLLELDWLRSRPQGRDLSQSRHALLSSPRSEYGSPRARPAYLQTRITT